MNHYDAVPLTMADEKQHLRKIAEAFNNGPNKGKFNAVTTVTLTASATSTTLTDERITAFSYLGFMPTTAHAATAFPNIYVTNQNKGSCTINHASSANVDQTFTVLIIG